MMRNCWAKIIRVRWFSAAGLFAAGLLAVLHGAATGDLKSLVRAYRANPTIAGSAAVEAYAAAHPNEDSLARLALGVVSYEQKDYAVAIATLQPLPAKLPKIADYAAFYLAAARVESSSFDGAAKDLAPVHSGEAHSPLEGKAWLLEARALQSTAPDGAVKTLCEHYAQLPQPDGAMALADSYQAFSIDLEPAHVEVIAGASHIGPGLQLVGIVEHQEPSLGFDAEVALCVDIHQASCAE